MKPDGRRGAVDSMIIRASTKPDFYRESRANLSEFAGRVIAAAFTWPHDCVFLLYTPSEFAFHLECS